MKSSFLTVINGVVLVVLVLSRSKYLVCDCVYGFGFWKSKFSLISAKFPLYWVRVMKLITGSSASTLFRMRDIFDLVVEFRKEIDVCFGCIALIKKLFELLTCIKINCILKLWFAKLLSCIEIWGTQIECLMRLLVFSFFQLGLVSCGSVTLEAWRLDLTVH